MQNDFGFTKHEFTKLKKLNSPTKIQDFLESLSFNHEKDTETCMSPKIVLKENKAHCLEGALFACVALWLNKEDPLLVNLKVKKGDDDHVVVLYRRNKLWGAISKTNHNVLRFRDPIYKNVRELAMSYFHEYFLLSNGEKTMLGYTKPINLKKFGKKWVTSEKNLWKIAEIIFDTPIIEVVPKESKKFLRKATKVEIESARIEEYKKS